MTFVRTKPFQLWEVESFRWDLSSADCAARSSGFSSPVWKELGGTGTGSRAGGEACLDVFPSCLLAHLLARLPPSSLSFLQKIFNNTDFVAVSVLGIGV